MKRYWFAVFTAISLLMGGGNLLFAQGMMPQSMGVPVVNTPNAYANYFPGYESGPGGLATVGYSATAAAAHQPGSCDTCCPEGWTDCNFVYGGLLYIRPRDAEIAYAVQANGPIVPGALVVQTGPVHLTDMDYQPGFFFGVGRFLDETSSIGIQYTKFEGNTNDSVTTTAPSVIRSLVAHPSTFTAAADGLSANAQQAIRFDIIDADYRNLFAYDCDYKLNYLVGFRGVQLEQNFNSAFQFNGTQTVVTDLDFYGAGIRLGLEGERYGRRGLLVYGKTFASFVPGEFRADYDQRSAIGVQVVDTAWRAGRTITMLDLEVGAGWESRGGHVRLTAGYEFSAWLNVVQTDEWIKGVQTNNFVDMTDKITFDGLVAKVEVRW